MAVSGRCSQKVDENETHHPGGAMPNITFKDQQLEVNEEGFLLKPELWTEELATFMAKEAEGIESLSDDHWAVIRFIRQHFLETQNPPMVRAMCKSTNLPLKRIYELFPGGPAKGACKVAGLPKPDGCV
jgi:TusE/DsrC/DsvC family sulfur relay protein